MIPSHWLSERSKAVEMSGIRKVFELARSLRDPVNLSIGQPHFEVPEPIRMAAKAAIDSGKNGYTVTQGIIELRTRLLADVHATLPKQTDRDLLITSGTSGGLMLAMMAVVNPGDEVVAADPYFVMYPNMVAMVGGKFVPVDTYPDFTLDPDRVEAACTPRTKMIVLCSPSNPTGAIIAPAVMKRIVEFARKRGILVVSDEIYKAFHYDGPGHSPAEFDENVLVIEGFGKTYGVTGWRLGFAHGPRELIEEMMKLQQSTFVCAPSAFQWAALAALDFDVSGIVADYKRKRDMLVAGLRGQFEFAIPGGAFYLFPKVPRGTGTAFIAEGVKRNLLVIPGNVFSRLDTHIRISYAASDETLQRGIEILNAVASS